MGFKVTVLGLSILLTGCATVPTAEQPQQILPTYGYVYFDTLYPFPVPAFNRLKSLSDGKVYNFISRKDKAENGNGVWVPEGEYRFENSSGHTPVGYSNIAVKAGRITDLQTITDLKIGGYKSYLLPVPNAENSAKVVALSAEFNSYIKDPTPLSWDIAGIPKPIDEVTPIFLTAGLVGALIMQVERNVNTPSINKQMESATTVADVVRLAKKAAKPTAFYGKADQQGNLYYGAELGQIRVRKTNGEWDAIDTGRLQQVTAVGVSGSTLIAGFRDGYISVSQDLGASWKQLDHPDSAAYVAGVDKVGKHWVILLARKVNIYTPINYEAVYVADNDQLNDLKKIKEITIKDNSVFWHRTWVANGLYYFNAYPDIHQFDESSMTFKRIPTPFNVTGYSVSPTGNIMSAFKFNGPFASFYTSTNQGLSWETRKFPASMEVIFLDEHKAQAPHWNQGALKSTIELMEYDANNNSWHKTVDAPADCRQMLWNAELEAKFCLLSSGTLAELNGKTWVEKFKVD